MTFRYVKSPTPAGNSFTKLRPDLPESLPLQQALHGNTDFCNINAVKIWGQLGSNVSIASAQIQQTLELERVFGLQQLEEMRPRDHEHGTALQPSDNRK